MHLENGIKQAFNNPFYAEEKVDGYNVRIVRFRVMCLPLPEGVMFVRSVLIDW